MKTKDIESCAATVAALFRSFWIASSLRVQPCRLMRYFLLVFHQVFKTYISTEEWTERTTVACLHILHDMMSSIMWKFQKLILNCHCVCEYNPYKITYMNFHAAQSINWNWLRAPTLRCEDYFRSFLCNFFYQQKHQRLHRICTNLYLMVS